MEIYAAPKLSRYTTALGVYNIKSFTYEINQHMHIYICTHIHAQTHARVHTYTQKHMRVCVYECTEENMSEKQE